MEASLGGACTRRDKEMGAIADGFVAFAQPLIDETDGSQEQLEHAFAVAQLCFNLALISEDERDESLRDAQQTLAMDNEEFDAFRKSVVVPMIRRHEEMFPLMHQPDSTVALQRDPWPQMHPRMEKPAEKRTTADRYASCPCNSGKKYKFCCGMKGRR